MDFSLARYNMVESQLRTNKVTSPALLEAFRTVPRERFVPLAKKAQSYLDEHVKVASDRWLMPPMPLGRLIQEAYPQETDNALVVGAGMGYSSAILGSLCRSVFALESNPELVKLMSEALTEQVLDNVVSVDGDLTQGYPKEGPYDLILITGGVEEVSQPLLDQLAEGGRLMAVVGAPGAVGHATLFGKRNGVISRRILFDAAVKPLPGFSRAPAFVF